jgi:hypothetical protein
VSDAQCGPPIDAFKAVFPISVAAEGHSAPGNYDVAAGSVASDIRNLHAVWSDGTTTTIPLVAGNLFVVISHDSTRHITRIEATEGATTVRCDSDKFYICSR